MFRNFVSNITLDAQRMMFTYMITTKLIVIDDAYVDNPYIVVDENWTAVVF